MAMKLVWLVGLLMTAFIAFLGSLLVEKSTHTTHAMVETTEVLTEQLRQQDEKLALAQSQLEQVSQQLAVIQQAQPDPAVQSVVIQSQLREDRAKQMALQQETVRLSKWNEKLKAEKSRIQAVQQQIDASKRQVEADDKLLDLEILTSVVESRVQKKLNAIASAQPPVNTKPVSDAPVVLRGADQFGEAPYSPPPNPAPPAIQVSHTDTSKTTSEIMARKAELVEVRKKLSSQQLALDEDKRKLEKEFALLNLQNQAHAKSIKNSALGSNP